MEKLKLVKKGKNCDIYENPDYPDLLFFNRTNRVSVGDVVLPVEVRYKGLIQNQMSLKWMNYLAETECIPNHIVAQDAKSLLAYGADASMAGSLIAAKKTYSVPVECIVRGYYIPESSSWKPYKETGEMYGNKLPAGLQESEKLPEPIYTPSTKAEAGLHDENISFEQTIPIIRKWLEENFEVFKNDYDEMAYQIATDLKTLSLDAYKAAHEYALNSNGIILADTKLEFGLVVGEDGDYDLILIDEAFTPDSSRFWDATKYKVGEPQPSMDKQFLRRILYQDLGWDGKSELPEIPYHAAEELSELYQNIYERTFAKRVITLSQEIIWEWKEAEDELYEIRSDNTAREIAEYEASLAEDELYAEDEDLED